MHLNTFLRISFLLIYLFSFYSFGQTTYTWIGTNNGSWATATNWSPTRTTPNTSDLLTFNTGTTLTITSVPTQTIGRLTISNNSSITLTSSAANRILTVGNQSSDDLIITAGSSLTVGTNLGMTIAANATANISGILAINTGRIYNTNGTFSCYNSYRHCC